MRSARTKIHKRKEEVPKEEVPKEKVSKEEVSKKKVPQEEKPKEEVSFYYTMRCPQRFCSTNISSKSDTLEESHSKFGISTTQSQEITLTKIKLAATILENYIVRTPCERSKLLDHMGIKLYLKKEYRQATDSYKARGVIYTLLRLSAQQRKKGVITASTGNFAYVLSFYGKRFNIPVVVVIPKSSIDGDKIKICRTYSKVFLEGYDLNEAHNFALKKAIELDMLYLDGYDHHDIIAGQATIGLEIIKQEPDIDTIVLPMVFDGCGLVAGIALAIKECNRNVKIIGVKPNYIFEPLTKTEEKKKKTSNSHELEVPVGGYNAFQILTNYSKCKLIDRVVPMREDWIKTAKTILRRNDNVGIICLSAILADDINDVIGKKVVIPLLGEIDTTRYLVSANRKLSIPLDYQSSVISRPE